MRRTWPNPHLEVRIVCDAEPGDPDHTGHAWPKPSIDAAVKSLVKQHAPDYMPDHRFRCLPTRLEVRDVSAWCDVTADFLTDDYQPKEDT
ncbi:MAG: hypothetical protein WC977_07905 [Anaerovoracaceae bacterium]